MRPQFRAPAAPALLTVIVVAVLAALLTGLPAHLLPPTAAAAGCTGSVINGTAFRDYNANGARDSREPGIGGIVVTVTGAGGASTSCTTAADGSYGIDPPVGSAGGFPVRLEFTLPADGSDLGPHRLSDSGAGRCGFPDDCHLCRRAQQWGRRRLSEPRRILRPERRGVGGARPRRSLPRLRRK